MTLNTILAKNWIVKHATQVLKLYLKPHDYENIGHNLSDMPYYAYTNLCLVH